MSGWYSSGDAALASRERKIAAQLAERVDGRKRKGASFRHAFNVLYDRRYVEQRLVYLTLMFSIAESQPFHSKAALIKRTPRRLRRVWSNPVGLS